MGHSILFSVVGYRFVCFATVFYDFYKGKETCSQVQKYASDDSILLYCHRLFRDGEDIYKSSVF